MNFGLFSEDAFLYKDLTQWLRRRTFVPTFFGLLGLAELISYCIMLGSKGMEGVAGPSIFGAMTSIIVLFMLIIAFSNNAHTNREFTNGTFELYSLAGMSPERMALGKFWTQMAQFLFGFFCIIPFMFFAFILGGVDFTHILYSAAIMLLVSIPIFLLSVMFAYGKKARRRFGILRIIGGIFGVLFLVNMIVPLIFGVFMGGSMMRGGFRFSSVVYSGNVLTGFLLFFLFYSQICLMLFYITCDRIAPDADSRETPVKLLVFTISMSLLAVNGFSVYTHGRVEIFHFPNIVIFLLFCIIGMRTLFRHPSPPPLALRRAERAGLWRRWIYRVFAPGAQGSLNMVLLLIAVLVAFVGLGPMIFAKHSVEMSDLASVFSLPVQAPFFIAFPGIMLLGTNRFRGRGTGNIRKTIFLIWIFSALLLFLVAAVTISIDSLCSFDLFALLGTIVSPFTSIFASVALFDDVGESAFFVFLFRAVTAVAGVALMAIVVAARKQQCMHPPACPQEGSAGVSPVKHL